MSDKTSKSSKTRSQSIDEDDLGRRTVNVAAVKAMLQSDREECMKELSVTVALEVKQLNRELLDKLTTVIDDRFSHFTETVVKLEQTIEENKSEIDALKSQINDYKQEGLKQKHDIDSLKSDISDLKANFIYVEKRCNTAVDKIKSLEERIESRTNKQLRKTLVISGLKEKASETWDQTRRLVAKAISENIKTLDYHSAYDMFERVHRGPSTKNPMKKGQRDIFAAVHEWDDCEYLVDKFRNLNSRNRDLKLYISYKYGPLTTRRRNSALKERKRLLNENAIAGGYVAFPARLFVKYQNDGVYEFLEDFSSREIPGVSLNFEPVDDDQEVEESVSNS